MNNTPVSKARRNHVVLVEFFRSGYGFRALECAHAAGKRVTLITADPSAAERYVPPALKPVLHVQQVPTTRRNDLEAALSAVHSENPITCLLCVHDEILVDVAEIAAGITLPFTSASAVKTARNKDQVRRLCQTLGFASPRFAVASSVSEAVAAGAMVGFPCVVKPPRGSGSADVALCWNHDQLKATVDRLQSSRMSGGGDLILIEEYLKGPLVGVETVTFEGHTRVLGFTDRTLGPLPHFVELSAAFPVDFGPETNRQLQDAAVGLLSAIGFNIGFAHNEFILTERGPVLVEINPRFPGMHWGPMLSQAYGVDMFEQWVRMFSGQGGPEIPDAPVRAAAGQFVYPVRPGTLEAVTGVEIASTYPGVVDVITRLAPGSAANTHDNAGYVAMVLAHAPTASLAAVRAQVSSTALRVEYRQFERPD